MRRQRAFTLVELLVVMGIIALLISILLPTMRRVREFSQNIMCRNNLRQVGICLRMYANDNRDRYPDSYTLGGSVYRMAPGHKNANDPFSLMECYGMPAVLAGISYTDDLTNGLPHARYLAGNSNVWMCPSMPDWMRNYGNTYFWNQSNTTMNLTSIGRGASKNGQTIVVQDNVSFYADIPGFRRTTGGPQVITPTSNYIYPHHFRGSHTRFDASTRIQGAVNVLFLNGQDGTVVYTYLNGNLNSEVIQ